MKKYLSFVQQWRYLIIIASIVITGLMGQAAGTLFQNPNNDYRVFFNEDNPELNTYDLLQNTYSNADNVLFVVSAKDLSVFNEKTLKALLWLTEEAWQLPFSTRVDSIANYQHTEAEEDDLIVAEVYDEDTNFSRKKISDIKQTIMAEPTLIRRLIAADNKAAGININFSLPEGSATTAAQLEIAN